MNKDTPPFNSYRKSLRKTYAYISLLFAIFIISLLYLLKIREDNINTRNQINFIELNSLQQFKNQQEFILFGTKDSNFYINHTSSNIQKNYQLSGDIKIKLQLIIISGEESNFIQDVLNLQNKYDETFSYLTIELLNRGYKEYGIEGKMRKYAHILMQNKKLNQELILSLRRHEKDFIIRKEIIYKSKFDNQVEDLIKQINFSQYPHEIKDNLKLIVNKYQYNFNELVNSENKLYGTPNKIGLYQKLHQQHNQIYDRLNTINSILSIQYNQILKKLLMAFILLLLLLIFFTFIFSRKFTEELTSPIIDLNKYMREFVESDYKIIPKAKTETKIIEFATLTTSFRTMAHDIKDYIQNIDLKVKERTTLIEDQVSLLENQRVEISRNYAKLVEKNVELNKSKKLIEQKNNEIFDSLRYAQRIQKTLMLTIEQIRYITPKSFVFFIPKDIVSGDFYFFYEKQDNLFFAVADCTGHGVPGAFMSFIAIHALQKEIIDADEIDCAIILNKVNVQMKKNTQIESERINDGMDIALCCLNKRTKILNFAGANIPLWISSFSDFSYIDNKISTEFKGINDHKIFITEIKADKQPIGNYIDSIEFASKNIQLTQGDHLYIFSDGYADQFGGPHGKKYKYSNLRKLIYNLKNLPLEKQKQHIREEFTTWKKSFEQVDDVCVMGMEIS